MSLAHQPAFHLPLSLHLAAAPRSLLPSSPWPQRAQRGPPPILSIASTPTPPSLPRPPPDPSEDSPTGRPLLPLVGRAELARAVHSAHMQAAGYRLVCVMFFAPFCRTCKALRPKVERIAAQYPQVGFYLLDYSEPENTEMCRQLKVRLLPTFHLYDGREQRAAAFTTGPFGQQVLRKRLNEILLPRTP